MSDEKESSQRIEIHSDAVEVIDDDEVSSSAPQRPVSSTIGTGSFVAVSCSVLAVLITLVILLILFLVRWLG